MLKKLAMIFSCLLLFLSDGDILRADEIKKEFAQEYPEIGIIIGFGAGSKIDRPQIEIKKVFNDSSARKTGLLPEDKILAINGVTIEEIIAKKADCPEKILDMVKDEIKKRIESENSVILRIKRTGCVDEKDEKFNGNKNPAIGLLSIDFTVGK